MGCGTESDPNGTRLRANVHRIEPRKQCTNAVKPLYKSLNLVPFGSDPIHPIHSTKGRLRRKSRQCADSLRLHVLLRVRTKKDIQVSQENSIPRCLMLYYPKIPGSRHCPDRRCVAFEKYDGTNLHWDWDRDFSWHAFACLRNQA